MSFYLKHVNCILTHVVSLTAIMQGIGIILKNKGMAIIISATHKLMTLHISKALWHVFFFLNLSYDLNIKLTHDEIKQISLKNP